MFCPYCSKETKVLESRLKDSSVRRRRECLSCSVRFTTHEKPVFQLSVIKKDQREEPFQIQKIQDSLQKACSKTEAEIIHQITQRIERKVIQKKTNQLTTNQIGKLVLQELKKFDKIAYLRYATVHKDIDDPKLLEKELKRIKG
ncbi:MAG: transcriptional regulator NrdR [Nanoarchaeota archaeon]|nr:transcriptional regulator NrdR [Nanoarchaeota archaeon]MBU1622335.1 transcriptional regulator NrdR [Nanoarchaeota archaeon]MBU1974108.1 transcriptional regulator NrdR [Nanoarchaeota archaeon]